MSVVDMPNLAPALQSLVDARLDAIDRMLLGRVSRPERLDVVGEVEGRIHELLRERLGPGGEPSRDDVLAVLARLDPPEAYLPEGAMEPPPAPREPRPKRSGEPPASTPDPSRASWISATLGVASLGMLAMFPLGYSMGAITQSNGIMLMFWAIGWLGMFVGGLAGVITALWGHLNNLRYILGFVLGGASMLLALGLLRYA